MIGMFNNSRRNMLGASLCVLLMFGSTPTFAKGYTREFIELLQSIVDDSTQPSRRRRLPDLQKKVIPRRHSFGETNLTKAEKSLRDRQNLSTNPVGKFKPPQSSHTVSGSLRLPKDMPTPPTGKVIPAHVPATNVASSHTVKRLDNESKEPVGLPQVSLDVTDELWWNYMDLGMKWKHVLAQKDGFKTHTGDLKNCTRCCGGQVAAPGWGKCSRCSYKTKKSRGKIIGAVDGYQCINCATEKKACADCEKRNPYLLSENPTYFSGVQDEDFITIDRQKHYHRTLILNDGLGIEDIVIQKQGLPQRALLNDQQKLSKPAKGRTMPLLAIMGAGYHIINGFKKSVEDESRVPRGVVKHYDEEGACKYADEPDNKEYIKQYTLGYMSNSMNKRNKRRKMGDIDINVTVQDMIDDIENATYFTYYSKDKRNMHFYKNNNVAKAKLERPKNKEGGVISDRAWRNVYKSNTKDFKQYQKNVVTLLKSMVEDPKQTRVAAVRGIKTYSHRSKRTGAEIQKPSWVKKLIELSENIEYVLDFGSGKVALTDSQGNQPKEFNVKHNKNPTGMGKNKDQRFDDYLTNVERFLETKGLGIQNVTLRFTGDFRKNEADTQAVKSEFVAVLDERHFDHDTLTIEDEMDYASRHFLSILKPYYPKVYNFLFLEFGHGSRQGANYARVIKPIPRSTE